MREYLFRGKRKKDGEWVEGFLYHQEPSIARKEGTTWNPGGWFILQTAMENICGSRPTLYHEVDPDTVGQYAGMRDCKGQRIWEDSICRYQWGGVAVCMKVKFEQGEFLLCPIEGQNAEVWSIRICRESEYIEVIGNIHDNQELVEGDAEG